MKRLGTVWKLFCVIFGYLTVVTEADPNEHFEGLVGSSAEYMTYEFFDGILETLQIRLPNLRECFDHEKFHDLTPHGEQLSKNEFFNVSRAITNIIADKKCSGHFDTSRIPDGHTVADSLRNLSYHGDHDTASCFGEDTLTTESGDGLTTAVILYLYRGHCLLPEKDYFTSEYMKFFSHSPGNATKQSFINLVQQLGIGEQQSHDGHDHGSGGDDHAGHNHETEDHGHGTGDDHDHHGSHETDTDHDDHDHHGSNEMDTDHDDHDHHGSNETDTDHDDHDHHGSNETDTDHDDHDHHGSNETDTDHDDHDHHGSNETDTDHDDHDHHGSNETDTDHDDHDHHGSNETDTDHDDHDHHGSNDTDHTPVSTASPVNITDHEDDHEDDHDHAHSRRKRSSRDDEAPRCFTGDQLADIYGIGSTISESQALEICPALIQQIISGACNSTEDSHGTDRTGYTQAMIYGYGTLSVAIISLLALLGLLLFPVLESKTYKLAMQFFIGLAIGTMASDALIHIIPKVLGVHDHGAHDNHDHAAGEEDMTFVWQMSLVLGGLYIVLLFENLLKAIKRSRQTKDASNSHENAETLDGNGTSVDGEAPLDDLTDSKRQMGSKSTLDSDEMNELNIICWFFNPTLITVFIGDILHNFADGVAIGVAFASHWSAGISTSIAILCHELPHEFGDFAIYLRNGASKWKAIGLNFTAACFAFIGLFSGINMASDENVRRWLLCIIAGIFLYISLVQVMSLMLREVSDRPILLFLIQNAGMVIGWVILLIIALYEGRIRVGA